MKIPFLFILTTTALLFSSKASIGQVAPNLGAASNFALFTAVGAFNNSGPTIINGDIGTNAGAFSGFPLGVVNGNIYVEDTRSLQAATAVNEAYGYMSSIPCVNTLAVYGGNPPVTLLPGSYCVGGATTLAGTLILDGNGDPNAKFFLRVTGALTTGANSAVLTQNGASASNVYWQIGGMVTLGRKSVMQGTLLVDGAINMIKGATLIGRGLSRAGAITIDTNTASLPGVDAQPAATTTTWLGNPRGTGTTDWFTSGNWSNGVPTSSVDALVPTRSSPYPVIASGNAAANGLTIDTGASLTQGGGSLELKGNLNNDGAISATAGTVTLSGPRTQILAGSGSTQFWSLSVANANNVIQGQAVSIHGVLAPANGNLTTNGQTLTLLSDAAGTALVNNSGTGIVNGIVIMQRYIDPSQNDQLGYRHYSSPVSNTTLADLATTGFMPVFNSAYNTSAMPKTVTPFPTVFDYDETRVATSPATDLSAFDKGFFSPAAGDATPMTMLSGYTVNINFNQVVDLRGSLNNGAVSRPTLTRGVGPDAGWHLLGNPYPSPIDLSRTSGITRTNMDDAVYVYQSTGPYTGQYRSYVQGVGTPLLSAMQGFFTRVSDGQTTGSFGLNNAVRVTTLATQPSFNRGTADSRPLVQLQLKGSKPQLTDDAYVYFEQGATAGFDAHYDAFKLPNTSGLSLGSMALGTELSINGLAPLTATTMVPLNILVPAMGTYTLNAASLVNFGTGTQVFLLDTQTGARINLSQQPSYTFQASTTALPGRFGLAFELASPLATQNAALAERVQLFPNPAHRSFTLALPAELGRMPVAVKVINSLGQLVSERMVAMTPAGASAQFDVSALAPGVYSLRITSTSGPVVKRVIVE